MQILEILGKIGFDWKLALANLINIGIIFLVLYKFAFTPIKQKISERESVIKKGLSQARDAEISLQDAEAEREEIIKQAKRDAMLILEETDRQKKNILKEAEMKAIKEKEILLAKAEMQIMQEKKEMEQALTDKSADLIAEGLRKILADEMTESLNEKIVKKVTEHA